MLCWCGFGHARVCGTIVFRTSPLAEVLVLVDGCSVGVFVGDWVGG